MGLWGGPLAGVRRLYIAHAPYFEWHYLCGCPPSSLFAYYWGQGANIVLTPFRKEMVAGLQAAKKYDLLPVTELLASLVLKDQADQEWIKRRFAMLQDALRETPAYQRILQEGREEGREEEREALQKEFQRWQKELQQQQEALQQQQVALQQQQVALQKALQQQQEALQQQRDILLDVVFDSFPLLARRARDYAKSIDDPIKLSLLSLKMAKASTAEEAERILRDAEKGDKETN